MPSTFAELLAFDHLLETESDPVTRRALISERVEGSFATVFRQTVLTRYEQRAYALRGEGGTLTSRPALGDLVRGERQVLRRQRRAARQVPAGLVLHPPLHPTRFYTYAYVFAHLSTLALYARYREAGADFVDGYIDFLSAGGSRTPTELLGGLGVNLEDPAAWEPGLPRDGADGGGRRGGLTPASAPPEDQPLEAFLEAFSGLSAFWTCSGSSPIG